MAATKLERRPVARIWGRGALPAGFAGCATGEPVGEVWFDGGGTDPLLVKYLFTAERLSIQVHPDDAMARAHGHPHGKDEAWLVLDAEPGAAIGLGLTRPLSREELRSAARDGSIERLVDWRPVRAGDAFFSPAGTIHAIGAGLTLVEVQQNVDLTYRLYDYGRPRELHLDAAVAAAFPGPLPPAAAPFAPWPGRRLLAAGGPFTLERWSVRGRYRAAPGTLLVPLRDRGALDGEPLETGNVWRAGEGTVLEAERGLDLLAAYPGPPEAGRLARDQSLVLSVHSSGKARFASVP